MSRKKKNSESLPHKFEKVIPISLPQAEAGALYVGVDAEMVADVDFLRGANFVGCGQVVPGDRLAFVHVMSRPAGGEIRGYVLYDGQLRLRLPCYTGAWPEMDRVVAEAVGVTEIQVTP